MSQDPRHTDDKFETHYRQQLSALVDGELAPDEARFLLRRLQHDGELSGRFERWQLCGDVLRGQVRRTAAADFSVRVADAIAAEAAAGMSQPTAGGRRPSWTRWGGGAAIAASVAAVAMLVSHQIAVDPIAAPVPAVAIQTLPSTDAVLAPMPAPVAHGTEAPSIAAAQPRSLPSTPQREPLRAVASASAPVPASARPAARPADNVMPEPLAVTAPPVALAAAAETPAILPPADPFASPAPLQARPWPRAALPSPAGGDYTASFGATSASRPFYPFEPSLDAAPATGGDDATGDLPAPPDDGGQY